MLLEHLGRWRAAVQDRRLADARAALHSVAVAGRMLAIDPEFQRLFSQHRADGDPAHAAESLTGFLHAVTDTQVPGSYRAPRD